MEILKKYRKVVSVAAGVLAVLFVLGGLGRRAGVFDRVQLKINAPMMTIRGERFFIEISAKNSDRRVHRLYEVVLSPWYLEGVAVGRTEPAFENLYVDKDAHRYRFDTPIKPGQELSVQFEALAAKTGDFPATVKVCFDGQRSCVPYPIRTIIEEQ
jgi:hypothetical protein